MHDSGVAKHTLFAVFIASGTGLTQSLLLRTKFFPGRTRAQMPELPPHKKEAAGMSNLCFQRDGQTGGVFRVVCDTDDDRQRAGTDRYGRCQNGS